MVDLNDTYVAYANTIVPDISRFNMLLSLLKFVS